MLPETEITKEVLTELVRHRSPSSVTYYLPSSRVPRDTERARLELKNALDRSRDELRGLRRPEVDELLLPAEALFEDKEFWDASRETIGIFAAPGFFRAFAFDAPFDLRVAVGDRFEVGPLLRADALGHRAWVLSITRGETRLYELDGGLTERRLDLPDDVHSSLRYAENHGDSDRDRAEGATGDRLDLERYCSAIHNAVLAVIENSRLPMILGADNELNAAYRAVNRYPSLLEAGLAAHLSLDEFESRSRQLLDRQRHEEVRSWKEKFGTRRSDGLATSKLTEVALAATTAAVNELFFDVDATASGTIDDQGRVKKGEGYNLADEIAARVLLSRGTVHAVHNADLIDGSPVAATLRFPLRA